MNTETMKSNLTSNVMLISSRTRSINNPRSEQWIVTWRMISSNVCLYLKFIITPIYTLWKSFYAPFWRAKKLTIHVERGKCQSLVPDAVVVYDQVAKKCD